MKSDKRIKELDEICGPYKMYVAVETFVGSNGKGRTLTRGEHVELTRGEFDALITSDYAKYL